MQKPPVVHSEGRMAISMPGRDAKPAKAPLHFGSVTFHQRHKWPYKPWYKWGIWETQTKPICLLSLQVVDGLPLGKTTWH